MPHELNRKPENLLRILSVSFFRNDLAGQATSFPGSLSGEAGAASPERDAGNEVGWTSWVGIWDYNPHQNCWNTRAIRALLLPPSPPFLMLKKCVKIVSPLCHPRDCVSSSSYCWPLMLMLQSDLWTELILAAPAMTTPVVRAQLRLILNKSRNFLPVYIWMLKAISTKRPAALQFQRWS